MALNPNWKPARPISPAPGVSTKTKHLVRGHELEGIGRNSSEGHQVDVIHQDIVSNHHAACSSILNSIASSLAHLRDAQGVRDGFILDHQSRSITLLSLCRRRRWIVAAAAASTPGAGGSHVVCGTTSQAFLVKEGCCSTFGAALLGKSMTLSSFPFSFWPSLAKTLSSSFWVARTLWRWAHGCLITATWWCQCHHRVVSSGSFQVGKLPSSIQVRSI